MEKEEKPKRNLVKRFFKIFAWLFLALFLLVLLTGFFLQTRWGSRFLLKQASRIVEEKTGLILQAESLRLNVFALKLSISGLKLVSSEKSELPLKEISCERVLFQTGWSTLTGGELRIKNLEIIKPEVSLVTSGEKPGTPESEAQIPEKASSQAAQFSFRIDRFRLEKGYLSFREESIPVSLSLSELKASIGYDEASHFHQAQLTAGPSLLGIGQGKANIKNLELQAGFNQETIRLKNLVMDTDESGFKATGKIDNYLKTPRLDLKTEGHLSLDEVSRLLTLGNSYSGILSWEIMVSGDLSWPLLSGNISGPDLKVYGLSPVGLELQLSSGADSAILARGLARVSEGKINLEARIPPALKGVFSSSLEFQQLGLRLLSSFLPSFPVELKSEMSGQAEIQAEEFSLRNARGRAELKVKPLPTVDSAQQKPGIPLTGNISLTYADGLLNINKCDLRFLDSQLDFKGRLEEGQNILGDLSWKIEDLQAVVKALQTSGVDEMAAGLREQLKVIENIRGSLSLEAGVKGSISRPVFNLVFAGRNLAYQGLNLPQLEIKAAGNLESFNLNQFLARFDRGQIVGEGKFRKLAGGQHSDFGLDGQMTISELDLTQFAGLLEEKNRKYLNGLLSGSIKLTGTSLQPQSEFNLSVSGTEVDSLKLNSLEVLGELNSKELNLKKIELIFPESRLQGSFVFRPDSGEIQADLSGQRLKAALFQAWVPKIQAGQVDFQLKTSGNWKSPQAQLKISGQGFVIDKIWFPYFEFLAEADGKRAEAHLEVPRFNLKLLSQLEFKKPYLLSGQLQIQDLPLSNLAGILPGIEENAPEVALTTTTKFSVPLEKPEDLQAEFRFENFDFAGLAVLIPGLKTLNPGGGANGQIKIKGFSSDLKKTELLVEIPQLNLTLSGIEIRNQGPLALSLKNRILEIENFALQTEKSSLSLSGRSEIKDLKNPELNFRLDGEVDLSEIGPWLSGLTAGGKIKLQSSLKGNTQEPLIEGSGEIQNIYLRMQDLPLVLSEVRALIKVDNSRLKLEQLAGLANNGNLTGSGQAIFGPNFSLASARIDLELKDFDFNYPQGFNSLSEAKLALSKEKRGWLLSGDLALLTASYREDFYPSTQGLKMAFSRVSPVGTEFPAFLYDLALDLNLKTVENIVIKNNLADLEIQANLNVKGTIPAPILSGRLESAYTGEIIVGDRKYTLERARVDFLGRENLEPNLDIVLKSTVYDQEEEIEATLVLTGTPSDLNFSLTSTPARSQEDLASLLLTGKSLREVQGSALNTISSQLVQHFSSPLASPVTKTLKKWLKAEDVILEPLNIATLQDPGARLTVRKRMTREFAVTYSIDLTNSQYQTWILDYRLNRNFSTRGFRRDDGVVGLNLRHRINFGQKADSSQQDKIIKKKLKRIEIGGETIFPENQITKVLKLKVGRSYRTAALRQASNRLEAFYRQHGYINARVEEEIEELGEGGQNLKLKIQPGPPAEFRFTGDKIPAKARKKALGSWLGRLPEEANIFQLKAMLLNELNRRGYYQATVSLNKKQQDGKIVYEVLARLNGKWKIESFELSGNPVFKKSLIKKIVSNYFGAKARGLWNLVYDRKIALELIEYFYQENGYLRPEIEAPVVEADSNRRRLHLQLKIEAGPRSQVSSLDISGNTKFSTEELAASLNLKPGSIFSWPALNEDRTALINHYRSAGFRDVRVETRAEPVGSGPYYKVVISIEEGPVYTISSVDLEGTRRTKPSFVLRETGLKPGEPVSLEKLAQAQKNLYDASVFQSVNVGSVPQPTDEHQEKVLVRVQEMPWLSFSYGLQYNTDTKFEGLVQLDFNNLLGRGWNSLLYFRANQRQQDARASLKIPYIFSRKTDSLLSFYYLKDIKDLFITEEFGASFQQKIMIVRGFDLSWVYRLSRIHDYEKEPSWPFPYDVRILSSELSLLLNRDTRDDKFDPHRGSLLTTSLSYSPRFLGSDLNYVRSFTQFTMYKSVLPGVIWASCYRLGLASAFGEVLIPSKRFFAGGGTSIRGFKLDAVGPVDIWTGLPEGGEAMIVINQELRFRIYKIFRGVAFFDAGNVYSRLSEFNPGRLRTSAGLGLRIDSPLGLIRIDYGFNLKRRLDEPRGAFFFSIGQAF